MNYNKKMDYAPIMILTLCRYEKFVRCLESLRRNTGADKTDVFIALDYPIKENHKKGYEQIVKYLEGDFPEFHSMNVYKREQNLGAFRNYIEMKNELCNKYETFIYSDDDIEFSPNFLEYMNKSLEYYRNDENVIAVCGYSYPLKWDVSYKSTLFQTSVGCFMWGTGFWTSKYLKLESEMTGRIIRNSFDECIKKHYEKKLIKARYVDYANVIKNDKNRTLLDSCTDVGISLYMELFDKKVILPVVSKARNHGFDGSGVYCPNISNNIKPQKNNSSNYLYSKQIIDQNDQFIFIPDEKKANEKNKEMWDSFDSRTYITVLKAKIKFLIYKIFGKTKAERILKIN